MIRPGLPVPTLLRLRLQVQLTSNRVARSTRKLRQEVQTIIHNDLAALRNVPRLLPLPFQKARVELASVPAVLSPVEMLALMQDFDAHFQQLVDLFCWAAKDGIHDDRDERYAALRTWFLANYEPLRPRLLEHLEIQPDDLIVAEAGGTPSRDAFESLFLPTNVDAIINSESVIYRIMRTRCAVDACRDQMERIEMPRC